MAKSLEYQQTGPPTVTPFNGGTNAFFYARVFYPSASEFDGGTLTFPGPSSPQAFNISGFLDCCGDNGRGYQTPYLTKAAMDAAYPMGTYTLTATNSVTMVSQAVNISYLQDVYTADIPALTAASFNALGSASAPSLTSVSFNAFTPNAGANAGFGFFYIFDQTTSTTVFNAADFSPSTTSLSFGAGTLTAGHQYSYELIFNDRVAGMDGSVFTAANSDVRTFGNFFVPFAAVPEPATWGLMLMGFGLAGAALRRRGAMAPLPSLPASSPPP